MYKIFKLLNLTNFHFADTRPILDRRYVIPEQTFQLLTRNSDQQLTVFQVRILSVGKLKYLVTILRHVIKITQKCISSRTHFSQICVRDRMNECKLGYGLDPVCV